MIKRGWAVTTPSAAAATATADGEGEENKEADTDDKIEHRVPHLDIGKHEKRERADIPSFVRSSFMKYCSPKFRGRGPNLCNKFLVQQNWVRKNG